MIDFTCKNTQVKRDNTEIVRYRIGGLKHLQILLQVDISELRRSLCFFCGEKEIVIWVYCNTLLEWEVI